MPNKLSVDTAFAIELLLEREDDHHLAHVLPHEFDAPLPPGPQLRADVVDHRNAALVQLARQTKVEVGEIDKHGSVGLAPLGFGHHFVKQPEDARQMLHHFGQSDHGDLIGVDHQVASSLLHALAADAEKFQRCSFASR